MGIYLNPDNELFRSCLNSMIYVDKTEFIHFTNDIINTKNNMICVSRPRRFGKSMALEMLSAYYSKGCDSREMFENLKAGRKSGTDARAKRQEEVFGKNRNQYDVLYIDMQGIMDKVMFGEGVSEAVIHFYKSLKEMDVVERDNTKHPKLLAIQREIIKDMRKNEIYAQYIPENEEFLGSALQNVYTNTGNKFILLIDEWDCVFRNHENDKVLQDKYIDWLRGMFKNTELLPVYAFVYMTGILPIKRYGTQSALNNFREYTFLNPGKLAKFSGFTEEEVYELCAGYGVDFVEMSRWYNGYVFEKAGRIYNPRSVVCAIEDEAFHNYWTATGTYESIRKQIEMGFDGLKKMVVTMLGGGRCRVDVEKFQNDMVTFEDADDALTLLVHLGYLGYDSSAKEVYIPNREIKSEFIRAIKGEKYARTFTAIAKSEELLKATLEGDEQTVAEMIGQAHEEHASILKYNDENALSCIINIAYYEAQDDYKLLRELPSGKGFADIVFLPRKQSDKPAIVVELKWNQEAKTAIDQIKDRNYDGWLKDYIGEVLLVGISYNKESMDKKHDCVIEKLVL